METPLLDDYERSGLCRRSLFESKKLWHLAGPAIFTSICNYSLGALTQTFAGQVGELELAAVSIESSVIAGLGYGFLLGMGSALETLCGQAFGAGRLRMLGIYMQRSWVILFTTALVLTPVYIFSSYILKLVGVVDAMADLAGEFAIWMLPQLYAYAANFPIQKFLQSQRKVWAMAWVAAIVLIIHAFLSWLLILKLGWGLVGAAITLNLSWWLVVLGEFGYILVSCRDAWTGFSGLQGLVGIYQALPGLSSYAMISVGSLEFWYLMVLIVIVSHLPDQIIPVDAASICMNINGWDAMIAIGFNAAISVRVSNELGAGNAKGAKFAVWVVSVTSVLIGIVIIILVLSTRDVFPALFTSSTSVQAEVTKLASQIGITVALNSLQPVLSGVAVGAGWQAVIAYINIGCYYIVGLPAGILLGFKFNLGVEVNSLEPYSLEPQIVHGIWGGMIGGIVLQTNFDWRDAIKPVPSCECAQAELLFEVSPDA
ncbi:DETOXIFICATION 33 protein [Nymphaea thermarum]|nr:DETOXIFICATION 33 protein [Nymphaea thermarum]